MLRILGISGSLRRDSTIRTCSGRRPTCCRPGSSSTSTTAFAICRHTPRPDVEPAAPAVARLREMISSADGILIATPEYNGSIPGVLKNALDWASRPFPDNALRGKPVAVVGASTGLFGAVWSQAEVRKVLSVIGADVLENELPVGQADNAFFSDGALVEPEQRVSLADLVNILSAQAGAQEQAPSLAA